MSGTVRRTQETTWGVGQDPALNSAELRRDSLSRLQKGTAPSMTPELEQIIKGVTARLPKVQCEQLPVAHASDDDGLWFFRLPGREGEVQIESSTGMCPFLSESDGHPEWQVGATIDDVVSIVVQWLVK